MMKKLLLISITLLLGVMSNVSHAQTNPVVNITVNGTNYAATYFVGSYNNNLSFFSTTVSEAGYMPWWAGTDSRTSSSILANQFATQLASAPDIASLGWPYYSGSTGPALAVFTQNGAISAVTYGNEGSVDMGGSAGYRGTNASSQYYMVVTNLGAANPAAPEIDGSLAPKVGFLLGCLFLMFGRKKQHSDSDQMMSAC